MVGVAGKSKACKNCRKRRVQCDLKRPYCARCVKAKLVCLGYEREVIFVNRHPPSLATTAPGAALSSKYLHRGESLSDGSSGHNVNLDIRSSLVAEGLLEIPSLEDRPRMVKLLIQLYFPRGWKDDSMNNAQTCCGWLQEIADLKGKSQALDVALQSWYLSQLYVTGSNKIISMRMCLDIYSKALQRLRADLDDPNAKLRDETLATIVVISTNELFINPFDTAWKAHTSGISEILRVRSSAKAGESVHPHLCTRLHTICVLNSIIQRRSLVLTNREWRKLKYANNQGPVGEFDSLIDTMGELPVLLEETEALLKQADAGKHLMWGSHLVRSFSSIAQLLHCWQDRIQGLSDSPLFWATSSSLSPSREFKDNEDLFPLILHFRSPNEGICLILSWAVLGQIYCSLDRIYKVMEGTSLQSVSKFLEFHTSNGSGDIGDRVISSQADQFSRNFCFGQCVKYTRLLCQSLEYCHQVEIGTLGCQATTFPQWILRRFFRHRPGFEKELKWCEDFRTMTGPGYRCGIKLMNFEENMGYDA